MNEQVKSGINRLYTINRADLDGVRRGQIVISLCLIIFVIESFLIPLQLVFHRPLLTIIGLIISMVVNLGCVWLARRGSVTMAAWLLVSFTALMILLAPNDTYNSMTVLFFLTLPVIIASLVLNPPYIWLVYMAVVAVDLWVFQDSQYLDFSNPEHQLRLINVLLLPGIATIIGFIGARIIMTSVRMNMQQGSQLRQKTRELETLNSRLEDEIQARTSELQTALKEVRSQAETQQQLLTQVQEQRQTIREMSIPVLPLTNEVMVIPLVGDMDADRLRIMQDVALEAAEVSQTRYVILDITGVTVIDTFVARGIIDVIRALGFLGAQTLLVGIRPEVAQAMVGLGLDLNAFETAADLQGALSSIRR